MLPIVAASATTVARGLGEGVGWVPLRRPPDGSLAMALGRRGLLLSVVGLMHRPEVVETAMVWPWTLQEPSLRKGDWPVTNVYMFNFIPLLETDKGSQVTNSRLG